MKLSSRVNDAKMSITLKMSEKISRKIKAGENIYNMTSGQLPYKPSIAFIESIKKELNFLKSYQYSPIAGFKDLRESFISYTANKRDLNLENQDIDCIVSNGSKHSLYNALGAMINPGDEVILLAPYWVSYPEMIKFWGGVPVVVESRAFDAYTPAVEEIKEAITDKTKAIIVNSPNNPAGIHYPESWMKEFGKLLKENKEVVAISDELYSDLVYFDPKPVYFYQFDSDLLAQTAIIHGVSKSFASTGLRVGYCIAPAELTKAMARIQSQTTSGPNSLIQNALLHFDFESLSDFSEPILDRLRECSKIIRNSFRDKNLPHCFYQTNSAFYYLLDFSRMPFFERFSSECKGVDKSTEIVEEILEKTGVALVPGSEFGLPNSARMSMTLDLIPFAEAIDKLTSFVGKAQFKGNIY